MTTEIEIEEIEEFDIQIGIIRGNTIRKRLSLWKEFWLAFRYFNKLFTEKQSRVISVRVLLYLLHNGMLLLVVEPQKCFLSLGSHCIASFQNTRFYLLSITIGRTPSVPFNTGYRICFKKLFQSRQVC